MASSPPPPIEFAAEWSEIEALFARLRALALRETTVERFYAEFLQALVAELPVTGGVVWRRNQAGSVQAVCQQQPQTVDLIDGVASQRFHLVMVEEVARSGRPIVAAPHSSLLGHVNPTSATLTFAPVNDAQQAEYVLELFATPDRSSDEIAGVAPLLEAAAGVAAEFQRQARSRALAARLQAAEAVDAFALAVHARLGLEATAFTIVNESARLLGADRVSLIVCEGTRCRALAISGSASLDRRATIVRALESLSAAVAVTGSLRYPAESELPPQVEEALEAYIDAGHAIQLEVQLLATEHNAEAAEVRRAPLGVLVIEHFHAPDEPLAADTLAALARHSGAALANALVCERWTWFRLISRSSGEDALRERRSGRWKWWGAGTAALISAIGLIPVSFEVPAAGRLQPRARSDVFAPADGVIVKLLVQGGDRVEAQQPLAELSSPALDLQISEVLGKRQATEAAIAAARAFRLTEGGGNTDPARFAAQEAELAATLTGLEEQARILAAQREKLVVRSPLAGEIVTRDADRRLTARPVRAGDLLLRVADVGGPWQLELELKEHHVRNVVEARADDNELPVRFIIAATPAQSYAATLRNVGEAAQVDEQSRPYVPALAEAQELPTGAARPGASVQAKIRCGRRPLAYVWLHDVWDAIAERWWH